MATPKSIFQDPIIPNDAGPLCAPKPGRRRAAGPYLHRRRGGCAGTKLESAASAARGAIMAEKSYTSAVAQAPLLGDTIGENFDRAVARYGDRLALADVSAGRRQTYAELAADIDALALGLLQAGITKGDRVGIWAPNCAEWVYIQYATAKIGAILVNINPAYRTSELEY